MDENRYRSFILPNSLAAVSAIPLEDSTHATDGLENGIHIFELDGSFRETTETVRAYRRLRRDTRSGTITALGCCETARIYFLTENYNEMGYTELDTDNGCGCGCNCSCEDLSELTDASLTVIGNETFIVAAFRRSAYLYDCTGRRLTRLCTAESNELLTDFINPSDDLFAMSTLRGNLRTVTVSDKGCVQSAILDRSHTLRMLISAEDGIYGLFGRSYIYNRLIKIYSNGNLRLPNARDCIQNLQ